MKKSLNAPWLVTATLADGATMAKCTICPKFSHDKRDPDNPAKHSALTIMDSSALHVWARAHEASEIHSWYAAGRTVEPTDEEKTLAAIFGNDLAPRKAPFPHLGNKNSGARPRW